jgi:hypothetical protein
VDSTREQLTEQLDALRKEINERVAEREGRPVQLDLLAESAGIHSAAWWVAASAEELDGVNP